MKKLSILLFIFSMTLNSVIARDYTKLQVKELKHAQKYGTTQKVLQNQGTAAKYRFAVIDTNLKDPKIMKLGNYEKISDAKYAEKLKSDEIQYEKYKKQLCKRSVDNYNAQAKGEDYYRVYRIAEKLIRANKLDYINWRIAIYRNAEQPNAYTTNTNFIALSTSIIDTFIDNDDALAMIIGHEMGHALLGHQKRSGQLIAKMERYAKSASKGDTGSALVYAGMKRKFLIDSKNMEFAADVEGEKLAAHAGYDLQKGAEVLTYLTTLDMDRDYRHDHPDGRKRLENYYQNGKYFPQEIWTEMGKSNIYNSSVMNVVLSSDRKSIVLSTAKDRTDGYYSPESMQELYARLGYMSYLNKEFEKSLKYFEDLFSIDKTNASAYLYASYACEYLYNNTGESKYLNKAKEYAKSAKQLEPDNKYIVEQVNEL